MSQPIYAIDYLGAVACLSGTAYTSASLIASYPTATVIQKKTDDVQAIINGNVMFHITYDDASYLSTGKTYIFDKDCVLAIGIYKAIV